MATPIDSTGPTTPTASSPITGASALWTWFKGIGDWIKALSPTGATRYDTGWTDLTLASGFTGIARIRRIGKVAQFEAAGISGTIAASGVTTIIETIPAEYLPVARRARGSAILTGNTPGTAAMTGAGGIAIFNHSGAARSNINNATLTWFVD